ncbi:Prolipoprotein diacylglyceryl transferase [Anaerosphaera aminiphila DSM 21120]|uniref:Phosphatidylglycerol--prolipoprotein diacylglyceryl transferase n=1 Tax=Anaerosphaera aminiphila DSM 21120 TaxID=1120995 RepID=A0A1M5P216_9FIRM|nr:prolipoprotein diacylglyceryl transferase [Anaerosphaera aminiphila]SHG95822.1 Prolipoprotein diacylglyceryl transferase [Anaerosphaera aminiphila DSM 21120]
MNINSTAFTIFNIEVKWYGILIALGAFLAIYFAGKLAKRAGLYDDVVIDFAFLAIPFGIVGARLYYVIFEWDYYSAYPLEIINIRNGGLAIYGGIIAGIIVGYFFSKWKKINFLTLADCAMPGVSLAQGIGRWGNFINGEAHGGPTNLPWGILVNGQKVHPTFLYESILDIGIFIFLYFYLSKHKKFEGQLFMYYLIIYGIGRFLIEGLRTDSLYIGPIRASQLVSLIMIVVGVSYTIYKYKKADEI